MLTGGQDVERAKLFRRAVARHLAYAGWASEGQGVDRHLFGLKRMLLAGEGTPGLYTDAGYGRSSHWELSTSQLSSPFLDGWGYGEGEWCGARWGGADGPQLCRTGSGCRTRSGTGTCGGRSRRGGGTGGCWGTGWRRRRRRRGRCWGGPRGADYIMCRGHVRAGRSCWYTPTMHANKRARQDERKAKKQPLSCAECRRQVDPPPLSPRPRSPLPGSSSRSSAPLPPRPVLTPPSATVSSPASPARSAAAQRSVQTVRAPPPHTPPLTPPQAHSPRERAAGQSPPSPPSPLTPRQVHPRKHRAAPCKNHPDERSHTPARGRPRRQVPR